MPENWEILFERAMKQLEQSNIPKKDWSFGGGTVLAQKYNHRESKDIDIFFRDPQFLTYISPRLNDACENQLNLYAEQSNFVKLTFNEGEIDFIVSRQISEAIPTLQKIQGYHIYVDSPIEIMAKKVVYRADNFTPRDMFDLAFVYSMEKHLLLKNAHIFEEHLMILDERIENLHVSGRFATELAILHITAGGKIIQGKEYELCRKCLDDIAQKLEQNKKQDSKPSITRRFK